VLGTAQGLEARLVPARGYPLIVVPKAPLPRRPTLDLVRLPGRLLAAVRRAREHLEQVRADVVVGFGGYVSVPAYLAARRAGVPIVVHEANARPGIANRLGARVAAAVATAGPGVPLRGAVPVGLPLPRAVADLDRQGAGPQARAHFGLGPGPVLLVTGGSGVRDALGTEAPLTHQVLDYVDGMASAYAAADLVLCRAGAMTCAELAAVGLPAVYVPLPIGNGEQALNARPVVDAGGGLLVADADLDADYVQHTVLPLASDADRLAQMGSRAAALGHRDADERLVDLILTVLT
jgi:UDP-N-acetylglucosamine--N-acetylmuramyl-(pentapeptide) pyrophosphoryl-undecaprenol N-acetylglucosamine transferase